MSRLLIVKLLQDFDGAKELVATGGITTYTMGTGSGLAVESELSPFDADKKIPSKAGGSGEMRGIGRWSFRPHSMQAERGCAQQLRQIKARSALKRGQRLLQSQGDGYFWGFLFS